MGKKPLSLQAVVLLCRVSLGPIQLGYTKRTLDCTPPVEQNASPVGLAVESGIIFQQICTGQAFIER